MIKDYGNRHPDWVLAEKPPYSTYDARYGLKLARAREWLGRLDRGTAGSTHRYTNADGCRTWELSND
jgi:hypothetical protein